MDIIEVARQLGHAIQADERYKALERARIASDNDEQLQELIGEFNLHRLALNNAATGENADKEKLDQINKDLRHTYAEIMKNERMTAYNVAKQEMDSVMQRVTAILEQSVAGEDPDTADYDASTCGGDCSSCSGCH